MDTLGNLFWIFFIIIMIWPSLQKRMLENTRLKLMRKLEKKRKSRVIALVHRQETMSFLGFPLMRYINIEDSEEILRAIRLTPKDMPIDLILHTPGGLVLATEQIACALNKHPAKKTVFIPHYAMSGGTLISLAADEIVMDENAVLGPMDPQLGEYPAASVLKVLEKKDINEVDDKTIILADLAVKAINQVRNCIVNILKDNMDIEKAKQVAEKFTSGQWTHDYPITFEQAKEFGLPVSSDMPIEVYQFMNLFPQPPARRPSVQYIPIPYKKNAGSAEE